jgi:adenylate cyclase
MREVTIMMSDIRGFTTLSEQLPPDRVVSMLNRYLGAMTDIIMEYGGTIDEFLGDAILAVFGAPAAPRRRPRIARRAAPWRCRRRWRTSTRPTGRCLPGAADGHCPEHRHGDRRQHRLGATQQVRLCGSRDERDLAHRRRAGRGEILIADSTRNALLGAAYCYGDSREVQAPGIDELLTVHPTAGRTAVSDGRILLVEDNELNRDMLSRRLSRAGF